ncbi:MAG: DUF58 domain-containing protein, partial [Planctomycetota bacterium]
MTAPAAPRHRTEGAMETWTGQIGRILTSPPGRRGKADRRLQYAWKQKITRAGRTVLLVLFATAMAGTLVGLNSPLYHFAVFLVAFAVAGRLSQIAFRPKVRATRTLPDRTAAGARIEVTARLTNEGRLSAFDLAATEKAPPLEVAADPEPVYLDLLRPGETRTVTYGLTPAKRGVYEFDGPAVLSAFPFGVYHATRETPAPHRLLVYPRFAHLADIDLPTGRRHQPGGLQLVSRTGDSEEFIGNREYRSGDRIRDLDHRAWARVGRPVVREFQQEYLTRIALVVDTFVDAPLSRYGLSTFDPVRRRRAADLEAGVSLGAGVAEALSRREYVIDLFAAGPDLYHFQAGRSLAYLDNILDVLACIEPCPTS